MTAPSPDFSDASPAAAAGDGAPLRVVAIPRDPSTLFVYWVPARDDAPPELPERVRIVVAERVADREILCAEHSAACADRRAYVQTRRPGAEVVAIVERIGESGTELGRSTAVRMPRHSPAETAWPVWMRVVRTGEVTPGPTFPTWRPIGPEQLPTDVDPALLEPAGAERLTAHLLDQFAPLPVEPVGDAARPAYRVKPCPHPRPQALRPLGVRCRELPHDAELILTYEGDAPTAVRSEGGAVRVIYGPWRIVIESGGDGARAKLIDQWLLFLARSNETGRLSGEGVGGTENLLIGRGSEVFLQAGGYDEAADTEAARQALPGALGEIVMLGGSEHLARIRRYSQMLPVPESLPPVPEATSPIGPADTMRGDEPGGDDPGPAASPVPPPAIPNETGAPGTASASAQGGIAALSPELAATAILAELDARHPPAGLPTPRGAAAAAGRLVERRTAAPTVDSHDIRAVSARSARLAPPAPVPAAAAIDAGAMRAALLAVIAAVAGAAMAPLGWPAILPLVVSLLLLPPAGFASPNPGALPGAVVAAAATIVGFAIVIPFGLLQLAPFGGTLAALGIAAVGAGLLAPTLWPPAPDDDPADTTG
jgi:hypothetical protein